mmetsp:Transcript_6663/g.16127  ORF Transcript_6663/g.16127 Transcript_6663/m.16127 type:complete len:409 (-) Transcript_6663:122-1348(-)
MAPGAAPRLNLNAQYQAELSRRGLSFNIMLVGEAGLGKSTAIRALFRPFSPGPSAAWLTPITDPIRERTVGIVEHKLTLDSDGLAVDFTLIDCPGYGDSLDARESIQPILDFVEAKFARHFDAHVRGEVDHGHDNRVHCCLYFIGAHRLKGIDVQFMKELQKHVPIIPVIAKADTMTIAERDAFRRHIVSELEAAKVDCLQFSALNQPQPSTGPPEPKRRPTDLPLPPPPLVSWRALGAPFAICASETGTREYPWGTCDVEDPFHSDLPKLREVLLSSNIVRARERTHELYENSYASVRRRHEAAEASALAWRLRHQELALRAALLLAAAGALVYVGGRVRGALPEVRLGQLDRAATNLASSVAGASRATLRGVNAYALSPLVTAARGLASYARPSWWAKTVARRLED